MSRSFLSHVFQLPTLNVSTRGVQPEARCDVNCTANTAHQFRRLGISLFVILTHVVRESARNNECGPYQERLGAPGLDCTHRPVIDTHTHQSVYVCVLSVNTMDWTHFNPTRGGYIERLR
jgi:hypothetical protein